MAVNLQGLFQQLDSPQTNIPANQQNLMQRSGVQDPMLQQFGKGLASLFNIETRSPMEVAQGQIQAIKDPSSYEGMVQLAQAVMKIDPIKGAQLLAKAEEMKKAQMAELETAGEQSLSTANQARRVQSLATSLEQRGEDSLASLVRRGDPDAYKKGIDILGKSNFSITPKGDVVDTRTGEIKGKQSTGIAPEQKAALEKTARTLYGEENLDSILANINAGNITKAEDFKDYVKPLAKPAENVNIPVTLEKQVIEKANKASTALTSINNIDNVLSTAAREGIFDSSGGLLAQAKKQTLNALGLRDTELKLRTAATKEVNTEIINSLPAGVASDRDIEIFSRGFPPEGATLEEIFEYLQAARRIHAATADTSLMYENHLNSQILRGQQPTSIGYSQKLINYNNSINKLRDLTSQAQTAEERQRLVNQFAEVFGFIPTEYR
jgi:hypothetical protein